MIMRNAGAGMAVHRCVLALLLVLGLHVPATGRAAPARVSLSVQDADLRQVLHQIADAARLNLVLDEAVQGRVTLRVRARPALALIDELLAARGLGLEQVGETLRVASLEALTAGARQRRDWSLAQESREPVSTRLLTLRHARAADLARLVEGSGGAERLLGPRGRLDVDARTNTLLITDNARRQALWDGWLATLDRPSRQILVETRLVAVSRSQGSQLGVRWQLERPAVSLK
ncbi:MAG: secretin N-terminal domain-containing protein, partial [Perlucidibaca sp.]